MTSPWQLALGDAMSSLDPALQAYFGTIPAGSLGIGKGVFERVGTPRRWLWPLLDLVGSGGAIRSGWEHDVPFTVVNRPAGSTVRATRTFHFASGDWSMVDVVSFRNGSLVDRLGKPATIAARFSPSVFDGGLRLDSTDLSVRLGAVKLRIPAALAPRILLVEKRSGDRQLISLKVVAPVIGTLYEYSGHFTYAVASE